MGYFAEAQQHHPCEDATSGVSLVVHPTSGGLAMIQWTEAGRKGRVADVDQNNYLKCIVAVGDKRVPLDLSGAQILIPATGVRATRDKRRVREHSRIDPNRLPDILVRFMDMWRASQSAKLSQHEEPPMVGFENCFVCDGGCDSGCSGLDDLCSTSSSSSAKRNLKLVGCSLCLLNYHQHCCDRLMTWVNENMSVDEAFGAGAHLKRVSSAGFKSAYNSIYAESAAQYLDCTIPVWWCGSVFVGPQADTTVKSNVTT